MLEKFITSIASKFPSKEQIKKGSKSIADIQVGDVVQSSSGEWVKVVGKVPEHVPDRMFAMIFPSGTVKCSGNHLWTVWDEAGHVETFSTVEIYNAPMRSNLSFGASTGDKLISIKEVPPEPVTCIQLESEDHLFALSLPKGEVLTHNCQFRAGCGRLSGIASLMLFGNTIATTVNGNKPGAGMISSNGSVSGIQYYFENIEWIQGFYQTCGFDEKGHRKTTRVKEVAKEPVTMTDEEIEDLLDFKHEISRIEIDGIVGEVDKTEQQKFEEI